MRLTKQRSWIFGAESGEYSLTDAYEVIESIAGHELINEYHQKGSESSEGYDRRTSRGKGKSDSYHANILQDRIRRANEIIKSVNDETSSEDGVFIERADLICELLARLVVLPDNPKFNLVFLIAFLCQWSHELLPIYFCVIISVTPLSSFAAQFVLTILLLYVGNK